MFVDLLIDCSTSGERYFGSIHDRQILQTIESLIICTWVKRIDKFVAADRTCRDGYYSKGWWFIYE